MQISYFHPTLIDDSGKPFQVSHLVGNQATARITDFGFPESLFSSGMIDGKQGGLACGNNIRIPESYSVLRNRIEIDACPDDCVACGFSAIADVISDMEPEMESPMSVVEGDVCVTKYYVGYETYTCNYCGWLTVRDYDIAGDKPLEHWPICIVKGGK